MSKKLFMVFFGFVFLGINLDLTSMAADEDLVDVPEVEKVVNISPTKQKIMGGSFLRIERPADFKERRTGSPQILQILGSDGNSTGISVDIPDVNLNFNVPSDAKVTTLTRPGMKGVKIELADGKFVNVLLPDLNTFPNQQPGQCGPSIADSNDPAQAAAEQTRFMVERMQKNMVQLSKLDELFKKHDNDLISVKNDPEFKEIKPILKESYSMISSIPFFLAMGTNEIDLLKAKILEDAAKKAHFPGFEDLNQDVQELLDNTFNYSDHFIEFLENFSKHFTQNKAIQELLAD